MKTFIVQTGLDSTRQLEYQKILIPILINFFEKLKMILLKIC